MTLDKSSKDKLKAFVERIERLEGEKSELADERRRIRRGSDRRDDLRTAVFEEVEFGYYRHHVHKDGLKAWL